MVALCLAGALAGCLAAPARPTQTPPEREPALSPEREPALSPERGPALSPDLAVDRIIDRELDVTIAAENFFLTLEDLKERVETKLAQLERVALPPATLPAPAPISRPLTHSPSPGSTLPHLRALAGTAATARLDASFYNRETLSSLKAWCDGGLIASGDYRAARSRALNNAYFEAPSTGPSLFMLKLWYDDGLIAFGDYNAARSKVLWGQLTWETTSELERTFFHLLVLKLWYSDGLIAFGDYMAARSATFWRHPRASWAQPVETSSSELRELKELHGDGLIAYSDFQASRSRALWAAVR